MHRENETEICSESMELEQKRKKSKWKAINLYGNCAHRVADCMCEWPRVTYIETQHVYCKASYVLLFILACRLCVRSANPCTVICRIRAQCLFDHEILPADHIYTQTHILSVFHSICTFFTLISTVCFQNSGFELCNLKKMIQNSKWAIRLICFQTLFVHFKKDEMHKELF